MKSIRAFLAKDLRPYSVMENEDFQMLLHMSQPGYSIPSRRFHIHTQLNILRQKLKSRQQLW